MRNKVIYRKTIEELKDLIAHLEQNTRRRNDEFI